MFSGKKFMVYVYKPSPYYLRKMMTEEQRADILRLASSTTRKQLVTNTNPVYQRAYEVIKKEYASDVQKYENSFLWSPKFTPKQFTFIFLVPSILVVLFMFYLFYIQMPRTMIKNKKKYGIIYHDLEAKGFLDGWYEEYIKEDKVLKFEAYTLEDLERLHKEGMLANTPEETEKNIQKKKSRFIRGDRDFVLEQFKSN